MQYRIYFFIKFQDKQKILKIKKKMKQINLAIYKAGGLITEKNCFNQLHNTIICVSGEIYFQLKTNCKTSCKLFSNIKYFCIILEVFYAHSFIQLDKAKCQDQDVQYKGDTVLILKELSKNLWIFDLNW